MEGNYPYFRKSRDTDLHGSPRLLSFLHFPMPWDIDSKTHIFPIDEVCQRIRIWWNRSTHTLGNVWVPISKAPFMAWVFLDFPMLCDIAGETYAFLHFPYDEIHYFLPCENQDWTQQNQNTPIYIAIEQSLTLNNSLWIILASPEMRSNKKNDFNFAFP